MTTTGDCPKRDEKMNPVLYFAYGSNLDDAQMRERCANARVVGRATLPNYALVFGGFSHRWGGAVASVVRAKGACVEGLLYELGNVDLRELDRFEGHPFAYERVIRWVRDESGRRRRVMTYLQPEDGFEAWAPPATSPCSGTRTRAWASTSSPWLAQRGCRRERAPEPASRTHARLRLRHAPRR